MRMDTLAGRLRAARGTLSKYRLAQLAGIDRAYLSRLESGRQPLSSKTWKGWKEPLALHKVAAVLQVNPDWLLTGEGTPELPIDGHYAYERKPHFDLLSMLPALDYQQVLGDTGCVADPSTAQSVQQYFQRRLTIDQLTPEEREACAMLVWALMDIRHSSELIYREVLRVAQDIIAQAPNIKRSRAGRLLRHLQTAEARARRSRSKG